MIFVYNIRYPTFSIDNMTHYFKVVVDSTPEPLSLPDAGVLFTTKEHLHKFYGYGDYILPIVFPVEDPDFKLVQGPSGDCWRANKLSFGPRISMGDPNALLSFGLQIPSMWWASEKGHLSVLNWWKESGFELKYTNESMDGASAKGRVEVLEWWKNSGLELKYSGHSINKAAEYGHIEVLEWWKESGLSLRYDESALDWASANGQLEVLEWWKQSDFEIEYSNMAMDWASGSGHVAVLDWWRQSGFKLMYTSDAMLFADENDRVDVKEWWERSGLNY